MTEKTSEPGAQPVLREIGTVVRHEFRTLLLSWRALVPMGIYAGFGGLAMLLFIKIAGAASEQFQMMGGEEAAGGSLQSLAEQTVGGALRFAGWGNEGDIAEIFRDQVPLLIVFFFVLASYFLPLLVALVSFDQFSELSTRGARFALLRVRRLSYLAGKALAAAGTVSAFLAAMWLVVVVVTSVQGGTGVVSRAVGEGVRGWVLMTVLSLPYLSLTALVSSVVRPGLAFIGVLGAWIGLSIGSYFVGSFIPARLAYAGHDELATALAKLSVMFPWDSAPSLLSRHGPTLTQGVVNLLLLAMIGYVVTGVVVRRRDV